MNNKLTPFEEFVKEKVSGHESAYDSKSWNSVQSGLNRRGSGGSSWIFAAVSAALVVGTGVGYWLHHQTQSAHSNTPIEITNQTGQSSESNATSGWNVDHLETQNENAVSDANTNPTPAELIPLNTNSSESTNAASNPASSEMKADAQASQPAAPAAPSASGATLTFGASVRSACAGVDIDFQAANGPKSGSYLWNFGDGHFSDEINPKHKFAKSGTYDVSLSVTSDNGQINTTMVNDMITIEDAPNANFTWEFINQDPLTPQVKIVDLSERAQDYHWKSGSQECATPNCTFLLSGSQTITLIAANAHGCKDERVKGVSIHSGELLGAAQTVKMGKDAFMPKKLKQQGVHFTLEVYNSQHEKVFISTSKNKAWDGKNAVEGTYTWKAIVEGLSDDPEYYYGTITLAP